MIKFANNVCYLPVALASWCHKVTNLLVNTGSGNDLLRDDTKPFPAPMLI